MLSDGIERGEAKGNVQFHRLACLCISARFFPFSTNPSSLNIKRKKKLSRDWGINKVLALHIRIIATFRQTTKRRNKKRREKRG
jgi:hypothetical protein